VKPGDLVKQAPNVWFGVETFPVSTVADKNMLVLEVTPFVDSTPFHTETVRTLLEGKERVWHYGELEVFSETR
jgi:hypothetical protein